MNFQSLEGRDGVGPSDGIDEGNFSIFVVENVCVGWQALLNGVKYMSVYGRE